MNPKNNSAGRPTNDNIIKFSQQPRSTVSLLLIRERQKNLNGKEICCDDYSYTKITVKSESLCKTTQNNVYPGKSCFIPYKLDVNKLDTTFEETMARIKSSSCNGEKEPDEFNNLPFLNKEERQANQGVNTGIKLFSCFYPNCNYKTTNSSNMSKHKRTHSHKKYYLCDQCSFSTKYSNSLNVHKRLHTQEKPFTCPNCDYRCNSSSNLKKHFNHKHQSVSA